MASSQPPPSAKPFTHAIITFGQFSILKNKSWPRRASALPPAAPAPINSEISAPATKDFSPAPVINTAAIDALVYTSCITASSSAITCPFKAFSFSGLLMVMVKIPFSLLVSSVVYMVKNFCVWQPILKCMML